MNWPTMTLCEAAAMDAAHYGNWEASADWVPPCDELGTVEVHGYWLCQGCADALELLSHFGGSRTAEARKIMKRYALLWKFARFVIWWVLIPFMVGALVIGVRLLLGV